MIFSISKNGKSIAPFDSDWVPKELELESYILGGAESENGILNSAVFGEQMLLVRNQPSTFSKKRADILALDRQGNGVIIELKRDVGEAGVETQALQYLAAFAPFAGTAFIKEFSSNPTALEARVRGFVGEDAVDSLNKRHRIILVARRFDRTLFSMGKWFGANGVAFRCIEYTPFAVGDQKFLSFSVVFDHSPAEIFPISFSNALRAPETYWHNIGAADPDWWTYLKAKGEIPASWDNRIDDEGYRLLHSYVHGDRIVAYAAGHGALGWGVLQSPRYRLVDAGSKDDLMDGYLRHRLTIEWKAKAPHLDDALPAAEVRTRFGIYHPVSTSVTIDRQKADALVQELSRRFASS